MSKTDVISGSITRKYSYGYFLMLLIVVLIFVVSFFSSRVISRRYETTLGELLELNELFVNVENANHSLYDYYLYLRPTSQESCHENLNIAQLSVTHMLGQLDKNYSREVMDLCLTVQTYLDQGSELTEQLNLHGASGSVASNAVLEAAYHQTQNTISYINQSFKEIYSVKLVSVQLVQANIQNLRGILNTIQIVILSLALLLCILFYRQIVTGITRSVQKLTAFATSVTLNPTGQEYVELNTGDELAVFAKAFNEMLDTIKRQVVQIEEDSRVRELLQRAEVENLRMSSALQSSQMKLLQSRINPHFLFNTLNMISQTAYMENAEETAKLMEATAELLRYNLGKVTKTVTLYDEIENTRNYVYIQQCRFGTRIEFEFDIDETHAAQELPCMILQPLVENSITHGVGFMVNGGKVVVRLFAQDGHSCLEVEDNGCGISEEKIQEMRQAFDCQTKGDEHIGLENVYMRLCLYFNDDVKFDINSTPGKTLIHIELPLQ